MFNPRLREAFSNVTLEGMAAGLAVICADARARRALLTPAAGLLRPPDDAASCADAIMDLRRRTFGAAARRESPRYNWPVVLDSMMAVSAEALGAKHRELDPRQCAKRADAVAFKVDTPVIPREVCRCQPAAGRRRS